MGKKSRSFNFLIELLIVIVFFTITAIVCVNIFYHANHKSKMAMLITDASLTVENIVESLKLDDEILNQADNKENVYTLSYEGYEVRVEQIDEIASFKGRYIVYEVTAYADDQELISLETTSFRGERS
ncbi:MAG: hypothetical protein MR210_02400 [Erysipelotrichaceae bacterium]|nr:hypothetical protein [Erysipelotrichaceae bacterium]MDY5251192.1 hypothetical protein [Erysipelotrichaceae bacterium]